ncbi:hypothetical protein, partial [Micromonospora andamanensis]|uniref:hypothetical protein n=2 Tax=Micromonospora andamanensis TaxID=1287068 RepID=UPI0019507432
TSHSSISLGPITDLHTELKIMPMVTVLSLLGDLAGRPQGVPAFLAHAIRAGVPYDATRLLAPLFGPNATSIPHCLTPSVAVQDLDFASHLDHIATAASERLADEVAVLHPGEIPSHWQWVLRRPDKWIDAYVTTLRAAWNVFLPYWRLAQPLLDREIVRVGTASIRGCLDGVLSDLGPRWRYHEERLLIPDSHPEQFTVGDRRLVLTPTISGTGASVFDPDVADMVWLGYPTPGLHELWRPDQRPQNKDPLTLVLGPMRATLMRNADLNLSMSQLADLLHTAPSVVTYHCTALIDAGLLYRERHGRRIRVRLTGRGRALIDL